MHIFRQSLRDTFLNIIRIRNSVDGTIIGQAEDKLSSKCIQEGNDLPFKSFNVFCKFSLILNNSSFHHEFPLDTVSRLLLRDQSSRRQIEYFPKHPFLEIRITGECFEKLQLIHSLT